MNFTDLYRIANSLEEPFVSVERLRQEVRKSHQTIDDVLFNGCVLDREVSYGHMILFLERSSPYDDQFITACIRFDKTLSNAWARFVCAKELMHVFDTSLEKTNSRDKFLQLMDELENNPIDGSKMFKSERSAEWMALVTLCPLRLRKIAVENFKEGVPLQDIANSLRIPRGYMNAILGTRYLPMLEELTGEGTIKLKVVGR